MAIRLTTSNVPISGENAMKNEMKLPSLGWTIKRFLGHPRHGTLWKRLEI